MGERSCYTVTVLPLPPGGAAPHQEASPDCSVPPVWNKSSEWISSFPALWVASWEPLLQSHTTDFQGNLLGLTTGNLILATISTRILAHQNSYHSTQAVVPTSRFVHPEWQEADALSPGNTLGCRSIWLVFSSKEPWKFWSLVYSHSSRELSKNTTCSLTSLGT